MLSASTRAPKNEKAGTEIDDAQEVEIVGIMRTQSSLTSYTPRWDQFILKFVVSHCGYCVVEAGVFDLEIESREDEVGCE